MNSDSDWVVIGRFGRPHGIKGQIIVHSFTEPMENIMQYTQWHGYINKTWELLNIRHVNVTSKYILAVVDDYDDREKAALLTNVEIAVEKKCLPELKHGDYYWHELIGMRVVNLQGDEFGCVSSILPTGANDVLVVQGEKGRRLIPYLTGQFVRNIDKDQRIIFVDWDADF